MTFKSYAPSATTCILVAHSLTCSSFQGTSPSEICTTEPSHGNSTFERFECFDHVRAKWQQVSQRFHWHRHIVGILRREPGMAQTLRRRGPGLQIPGQHLRAKRSRGGGGQHAPVGFQSRIPWHFVKAMQVSARGDWRFKDEKLVDVKSKGQEPLMEIWWKSRKRFHEKLVTSYSTCIAHGIPIPPSHLHQAAMLMGASDPQDRRRRDAGQTATWKSDSHRTKHPTMEMDIDASWTGHENPRRVLLNFLHWGSYPIILWRYWKPTKIEKKYDNKSKNRKAPPRLQSGVIFISAFCKAGGAAGRPAKPRSASTNCGAILASVCADNSKLVSRRSPWTRLCGPGSSVW